MPKTAVAIDQSFLDGAKDRAGILLDGASNIQIVEAALRYLATRDSSIKLNTDYAVELTGIKRKTRVDADMFHWFDGHPHLRGKKNSFIATIAINEYIHSLSNDDTDYTPVRTFFREGTINEPEPEPIEPEVAETTVDEDETGDEDMMDFFEDDDV